MAVAEPVIVATLSSQTAVETLETRLPPVWPATSAAHCGFTYPFAPTYGLSTCGGQLVVHVDGEVGGVVGGVVGGREVGGVVGGVVGGRVVGGPVVGGAVVGPPPPLQATPLTVNAVGEVYVPLQRPLKPKLVEPPVATGALNDALDTATAPVVPVAGHVADQPWVSDSPLGRVKRSVHVVHASPGLLRVMFAVKPPTPGLSVHGDAAYVTLQPTAANAGNTGSAATPATTSAPIVSAATLRDLNRLTSSLMLVLLRDHGAVVGRAGRHAQTRVVALELALMRDYLSGARGTPTARRLDCWCRSRSVIARIAICRRPGRQMAYLS